MIKNKPIMDVCYTCKNECQKAAGTFESCHSCKDHQFKESIESIVDRNVTTVKYTHLVSCVPYDPNFDYQMSKE